MWSLNMVLFLSLGVVGYATDITAFDLPYHQDFSFRSTFKDQETVANWDTLPFGNVKSKNQIIYLPAQNCFLAASEMGLYSASLVSQSSFNISPFGEWKLIYEFDENISALTESPSDATGKSFFAFTYNNVVQVTIDDTVEGCSGVSSAATVLKVPHLWGEVKSATASAASNTLWVASSRQGLSQVSVNAGVVQTLDLESTGSLRSVYWVEAWEQLFVGTEVALYTYDYEGSVALRRRHEWVGAIIDTVPLDFSYDPVGNALWIAEMNSVHQLTNTGLLHRFGLAQGAPSAGISSVSVSGGFVWTGSDIGLSRLRTSADPTYQALTTSYEASVATHVSEMDIGSSERADPWRWQFFSEARYLPANTVLGVVSAGAAGGAAGDSVVLAITTTGLAVLQSKMWTLKDKAEAMGTFQNPRHNREGLTTGVNLAVYGDLNSYAQRCDDNDGLWTSMHAMGETYRYAVTKEPQAREWAWTAFEALEKLAIIPGAYPFFPARSFCHKSDSDTLAGCSGDPWMNSTQPGYEDFMWKSTTSSDELDGHLAVLPMLYDMVAETADEKQRVYDLIEGITGGILDNDLYLIDPATGEPTQWGFWNPAKVNDDPEHYSERGTNSLGFLAYCASAYSVTKDEKYRKAFWQLGIESGYIQNTLNSKITTPGEDNHSDNELLMQTWHILFYALNRLEDGDATKSELRRMTEALVPGLDRMWTIVQSERSPLWAAIYAGTCGRHIDARALSDAVWTLRRWAVDLIEWPVQNSGRWDLTESPFFPRDADPETSAHLMREILPPQERRTSKWNGDPFEYDGGSGMREEAPFVWRLPYYLMLYNGLITEPQV